MSGRTISAAWGGGLQMDLAKRLAHAVLLLHKEGGLTAEDFASWERITGAHVITISQLRNLAHAVLDFDRAAEREGRGP